MSLLLSVTKCVVVACARAATGSAASAAIVIMVLCIIDLLWSLEGPVIKRCFSAESSGRALLQLVSYQVIVDGRLPPHRPQQKGRLERRPVFYASMRFTGSTIRGFLHRVLDVADRAVRGALRLVHLAFGLKLFVAGQFTGRILDGALHLVGRAFDVFFVHGSFLLSINESKQQRPGVTRSSQSKQFFRFPKRGRQSSSSRTERPNRR